MVCVTARHYKLMETGSMKIVYAFVLVDFSGCKKINHDNVLSTGRKEESPHHALSSGAITLLSQACVCLPHDDVRSISGEILKISIV